MDNAEPPAASQTIVIERRERPGILRRVLVPLFWLVLFVLLLGSYLTYEPVLPTKLSERYVAGEITAPKIAIVEVGSLLLDDEVEHVLKQVRQARDDDQVRAVILRVDSPGGTVAGSDRVWREVESLRHDRKKVVVASFGGIAASGGYYVAAPADSIFAEPTTMTGSIGVILEIPQINGLLQKVGVEFETITTGEWKDSGSMFRPMTARERERWKVVIDESYQRFVRVVAQGRDLPLERVKSIADGKVFTAREAVQHKLVDTIGYLDDAILHAERLAKMETARVIRYARPLGLSDLLLASASRGGLRIDAEAPLRLRVPRMFYLAR